MGEEKENYKMIETKVGVYCVCVGVCEWYAVVSRHLCVCSCARRCIIHGTKGHTWCKMKDIPVRGGYDSRNKNSVYT